MFAQKLILKQDARRIIEGLPQKDQPNAKWRAWGPEAMIAFAIPHDEKYTKQFNEILKEVQAAQKKGSGHGAPGEHGLRTEEINTIMGNYMPLPYLGTIARDEIPTLMSKVREHEPCCFIINTDKHDKPGQHWVAINITSSSLEYFDSFADPMPKDLLGSIKPLIDKVHFPSYLRFKENAIVQQRANSSNCGFFCIQFLVNRLQGHKFVDVSGYSDALKGEKDLAAFKKRYPRFQLLKD
jgi:hypothetical protein